MMETLNTLVRRDALRIAGIYLAVAGAWIVGSDVLLHYWIPDLKTMESAQTIKGLVFVGLTASLLFVTIRSHVRKRLSIEEVLHSTRSLGDAIFHSANEAILLLDDEYRIMDANAKAEEYYGYFRRDLRGRSLESIRGASIDVVKEMELMRSHQPAPLRVETYHRHSSGREFPVEVSARSIQWEGQWIHVHMMHDVSERKEHVRRIERLNRIYAVLSDVNQTIVRVRDETLMFREACRIAVEKGGFLLAWIGKVDPEAHTLQVVSSSGPGVEYLADLRIDLADGDLSRGPTGMAVSRGSYVVSNHIATDPRMAPWRDRAMANGFRSSAAFPVKVDGIVRFVINFYSHEEGFFDDQEIQLLDEMSTDISFALEFNEARRAFEESQERYKSLFLYSPDAVLVNKAGRVAMANEACRRLFGANRAEDLIGRTPFELFHPQDHEAIRERIRLLREEGRPVPVREEHIVRFDGTIVDVEVVAAPFLVADKHEIHVIIRDITERKKAEARLRYQSRLMDEMGRVARIGGWEFDPRTGKGTWTDEVARIHDVDPADETNVERGLSFYSPEARAKIDQAIKDAIQHAQPYDLVLELVSAKGVHKWIRTIGEPRVEGGTVVQLRGSFQDITDHMRIDLALHESEDRFRAYVEQAADALFVHDFSGQFVYVNPQACASLGYTREELLQMNVVDVETDFDLARAQEAWSQIVPGRTTTLKGTQRRKDGSRFPVEVRFGCFDSKGERHYLGLVRDETERRKAEKQIESYNESLRQLAVQLETAREEERKHVAREIHDVLGQELTAIRMDLSMAASAGTIAEIKEQVQGTISVADRAIASVRRLARELRPDVLDRLGFIDSMRWLASEFTSHSKVPCEVRVEGDETDFQEPLASSLYRVVQESLTNAARHASAHHVEIVIRTTGKVLDLEVLDDGKGLAAEERKEPAGVGLLGMHERVMALGGTCVVENRPEGGTRVSVRMDLPKRTSGESHR